MKLQLKDFDSKIIECINNSKGRVRQCAKHSIYHLEKAWLIKDVDPEMAAFRAITAEEEAATAIMIAIKNLQYPNSNKLKFCDHSFKSAIFPFLISVGKFFSDLEPFQSLKPQIAVITKDNKNLLEVRLKMPNGQVLHPNPPLGFTVNNDQGIPYHFDNQLNELALSTGKTDALSYIKEIANLRNLLLYANENGFPKINGSIDQILTLRQNKVILLLKILCLIFPYRERALFVTQCINAFLLMMGSIKEDSIPEI